LLRAKEYAVAAELLRNTRTAVVERVLDRTPPSLMPLAFRLLDKDVAVEVFSNMEPMLQSDLIDGLADEHTQDLFSQLESSTQARLLDEVPAEVAQRLLASLGEHERNVAARILDYPDDSVGCRITVIYKYVRRNKNDATSLNIICKFAVDNYEINNHRLLIFGTTDYILLELLNQRRLLRAFTDSLVDDIMKPTQTVYIRDEAD